MGKVIDLDAERADITVQYQGKAYKMKELDPDLVLKWGRLRRERGRMVRHIEQLEEKASAPELADKQLETFEGNIEAEQQSLARHDTELFVQLLEGMNKEIALGMSYRQRAVIMREITQSMNVITAELEAEMETEEGEASQP